MPSYLAVKQESFGFSIASDYPMIRIEDLFALPNVI